jgi:hypothetical protein
MKSMRFNSVKLAEKIPPEANVKTRRGIDPADWLPEPICGLTQTVVKKMALARHIVDHERCACAPQVAI